MFFQLYTLLLAVGVGIAYAQHPYHAIKNADVDHPPAYSPARPPSIPLAVRNPYTSAWSSTGGQGTLNSGDVQFWRSGKSIGWEGIVSIDGISYEYLGAGSQNLPVLVNLKSAVPKSITYDSQYSNFTFAAGPVDLTASFFSPVTPKDLCRTSIPLSYLTTSIQATDNRTHKVAFYSDINTQWITAVDNSTIEWDFRKGSAKLNGTRILKDSSSVWARLKNPTPFGEIEDMPLWGNLTYSSSPNGASNFTYHGGRAIDSRYDFAMSHFLDNYVDPDFRGSNQKEPVLAFAHDFGSVSQASVRYSVGIIQEEVMQYFSGGRLRKLKPWWSKCYGDANDMISFHWNDFDESQRLARQFEMQLRNDVEDYYRANPAVTRDRDIEPVYTNGTDQFGRNYTFDPNTGYGFMNPNDFSGIAIPDVSESQAYYSILALSTRQAMGALTVAVPASGDSSVPLVFMKEISSDGNINTVDVIYPAMPFFLYANPELLKYMLEPLIQTQENGFYPFAFSMHDMGSNFPNASGHQDGREEWMPVEESGNMIIMAYAYYMFTGNADYLEAHYALLDRFARYLVDNSLIPATQGSTDDFASQLANQTNLAVKGIVGMRAMAQISGVVGRQDDAEEYSSTAAKYIQQWEYLGVDPSKSHTLLGYQWRSSWGLLYNAYPDKLFDLDLIPEHIYQMQSKWYLTVSQVFGVPLDCRSFQTKSDWQLWTAATCSPETRRLFVNGLAYWLNNTRSDQPLTDLYSTTNGDQVGAFTNRPVVGGHFSLLALHKANEGRMKSAGGRISAPPSSSRNLSSFRTLSKTLMSAGTVADLSSPHAE